MVNYKERGLSLSTCDQTPLSIVVPPVIHLQEGISCYLNKWFWTGSAATLEAQAKGAMTGPLAQSMNPELAEERLKQIPEYVRSFKQAYDSAPTFDNTLAAIAAFERTVVSKNVPFDRYMNGGKKVLSAMQLKGMELFGGEAGCIAGHGGAPQNKAFARDKS